MLTEKLDRVLAHGRPEQLFDLAADVERYPEFLRWWIAARIRRREGNIYYTDQIVGLGPLRVRFGSKSVLRRPERIDVISDEPPFRHFGLTWIFEPQPPEGCRVSVIAEMDLRSRVLQRVMERLLPGAVADIVAAFEARARLLYERAAPTGSENR